MPGLEKSDDPFGADSVHEAVAQANKARADQIVQLEVKPMAQEFKKKPGAFENGFMACLGAGVALLILAVLAAIAAKVFGFA